MSLSFCILSILENLGKGEGDQSRRTARRLQKKPKKEKEKDLDTISLCVDSCCNTAGSCDGITSVENLPLDCTLKSCKKASISLQSPCSVPAGSTT